MGKTGLKLAALSCALLLAQVAPAVPQTAAPINVGLVYSKTGLLGSYGQQYADGFYAGLDYATHGTGTVHGHKIVVTERDNGGDAAKAVAAAKDLIGQGYKIIAGTVWSGIALQLAPLAKENNILYISGPAATDAVTGANQNTFRSGRQTYQDVMTAGQIVGNLKGKRVVVFAQDSAFGQANFGAVKAVLGGEGADVSSIYVPLSANDFVPFAQKLKDAKADMVFVAWAGASAPAMWKAVDDAGVPSVSRVVTGLDQRSSYANFGPVASKVTFLSHYFYQAATNRVNSALIAELKKQGKVPDLFDPDGFVGALMVVHAIEVAGGDDVPKMIAGLEGWSFLGPKGPQTVRAADHAMMQPMFVARLVPVAGGSLEPQLIRTIPPNAVAPPVHPFK